MRNPSRYIDIQRRAKAKRKQAIYDIKRSRGCEMCGITDPVVLDFHHRDGEKKVLAVSQMAYNAWDAVLDEINKCEVLCANCHRITHAVAA